ncbi:hypothetical protein T492DRAFT_134592 [Pavlovales sp. CCMP2436]|nr:hypothetical protein T492DRAFT_134592 [Pavlovales sp. CCMP2436]
MSTLIGLLIAGELYIDFRARTRHEEKLKEAKHCLRTLIEMEHGAELTVGTGERDNARDVFVSYCWHNSALAVEAMQVPQLYGNALIDPRRVAKAIKAAGLSTWLDIEELGSGSGLFEDIAAGLKEAKVVVICASSAYSRSDNCRMEMQYATKLLKKPAVLLVVDADEAWKQTVVGLLGGSLPTVDLASALTNGGEAGCDKAMAEIVKLVRTAAGEKSAKEGTSATVHPAEQPAAQPSGPQVGDAVISHHIAHTFYNATVVSFDKGSREFEVAWQDGDTTHTTQQFDRVFLDVEPDADEVGVGTRVLFPQGRYTYNGVSCARYNEGVITALEHDGEETFYAGKHAFGESDGKFFFRDQSPTFRCSLGQLRVAANLMAALMTADSDVRLPTGAANLAA